MIGQNLRRILRLVAWAMIVLGPVDVVRFSLDIASGSVPLTPGFVLQTINAVLTCLVVGGALLAILSIDERLERRA